MRRTICARICERLNDVPGNPGKLALGAAGSEGIRWPNPSNRSHIIGEILPIPSAPQTTMKANLCFAEVAVRGENSAEIRRVFALLCASTTRADVLDAMAQSRILPAPICNPRVASQDV
jgi:hypothetical protein